MLNLDLTLRTPGRVLMLERNTAQTLVDRAFEERQAPSGRSFLQRAFGAVARISRPHAQEDDDDGPTVDRSKLPTSQISWAGTVEWGDGYAIVEGVAVIDISGVLTPSGYYDWWSDCWYGGYDQIEAAIVAAREDDRIKAILLRVDSPGGLADGCFDLADTIRSGNGAAGGKPVWAYVRLSCSAAYALTSAADHIVAAAESYVGSIGVVITHYDVSGYYAEHGIKVEAIQSGSRKTDGAEWKPLSDDARKHFQAIVDQCARRFAATVSTGRGLTTDAIVALQAQFFLAAHDDPTQSGLALKLVDEIASERAAFMALQKSLASSTGGAPAGSGSQAASDATRAATTETDMALKDQITALRDKAAKGDAAAIAELKEMGVSLKADTPADDKGDDEDAEDKADGGADDDAEDKDDEDDKDDKDKEPKASATGTKAGFALLRHKEAKSRSALATRLAEKVSGGKLTFGEALEMLADAPKAKPLAESMAGRDHNPGRDAGEPSKGSAGLGAAVDRMNAKKTGTR